LSGNALGDYLAKVTQALVPRVPNGSDLLEAFKSLLPITGDYPKNAEKDKMWIANAINNKHGIL